MADPVTDNGPPRDAGAVEAHYSAVRTDMADQRDRIRAVQERLTATLQLNSITVAVFIGLILIKLGPGGITIAVEVPAAAGIAVVMCSAVCVVIGFLSGSQWGVLDQSASARAASTMSRLDYLLWAASEMSRTYHDNEHRLVWKGRWATAALVLAVIGITLAGAITIAVFIE